MRLQDLKTIRVIKGAVAPFYFDSNVDFIFKGYYTNITKVSLIELY